MSALSKSVTLRHSYQHNTDKHCALETICTRHAGIISRKEVKKMKPERRMEFFLPRVLSSIEERPLPTMARRGGKETGGER